MLPFIEEHHLTLLSASSATEALLLVYPRFLEIGAVLLTSTGSSVPFDADQRLFTSVNERPPSPPNSAISFFGSENRNEIQTANRSESTGTGTSRWTNMTQLSSKKRLFVVETIHTILSRQKDSDRTPSTLASRQSPKAPIQTLSNSPLFFSSSIFDLDDTSLTNCLGQLAEIVLQEQTSDRFELSQPFVDGLVSCLGSTNKILSNCARLVLIRKLPLFRPFLLSHLDSLAKSYSEGTHDERTLTLRVFGDVVRDGLPLNCLSETLIHQICRTEFVEASTFVDALTILSISEKCHIFAPHSPPIVDSFGAFVDASIDLASFVLDEHGGLLSSDRALRNVCLSLFVYRAFATSRGKNWPLSEEVVELLFHPNFANFELRLLDFSPVLFFQTFPFELMIERMIRLCRFVDVLRGLGWWATLVASRSYPLRDLFSTLHPFFLRGFHQILLHPLPSSSPEGHVTSEWKATDQELCLIFAISQKQSLLSQLFPIENFLTLRARILTANRWSDDILVDDLNVTIFPSFTPFGECPALRSIFSILCQPGSQSHFDLLDQFAIVSSHSLPLHFDNPLLAFVQTLHPLVHVSRKEVRLFFDILTVIPDPISHTPPSPNTKELNSPVTLLHLHYAPRLVLNWLRPSRLKPTLRNLLSLSPVQVSLALLTLSRAVAASSRACLWLVLHSAIDVIVENGLTPTLFAQKHINEIAQMLSCGFSVNASLSDTASDVTVSVQFVRIIPPELVRETLRNHPSKRSPMSHFPPPNSSIALSSHHPPLVPPSTNSTSRRHVSVSPSFSFFSNQSSPPSLSRLSSPPTKSSVSISDFPPLPTPSFTRHTNSVSPQLHPHISSVDSNPSSFSSPSSAPDPRLSITSKPFIPKLILPSLPNQLSPSRSSSHTIPPPRNPFASIAAPSVLGDGDPFNDGWDEVPRDDLDFRGFTIRGEDSDGSEQVGEEIERDNDDELYSHCLSPDSVCSCVWNDFGDDCRPSHACKHDSWNDEFDFDQFAQYDKGDDDDEIRSLSASSVSF
ncbi:hypothetical protein BLNAU_1502 [Blattamonas nauphoetae]|uniref:Uncharacterized protein n=1 Tax=Blattamonas nauphoetae TaxID=2049346 RepID=A0ABQ9YI78_9EUKA|nr:hypothetical protein BLNAU_1502 [Blattamonas nauphoetae]